MTLTEKIKNVLGRFPLNRKLNAIQNRQFRLLREIEISRLAVGRLLANNVKNAGRLEKLNDAEFKIFSEWGDDGIIQYLIHQTKAAPKIFIEFGVEDYTEANSRFLLLNNNWKGLVLDGSPEQVQRIIRGENFWRHDLTAVTAFVTAENINDIISKAGFAGDIGLLSIDIDGNDYFVWQALSVVRPIIVVIEYNALFGAERAVVVPYEKDFRRERAHYSHLYFGASLPALCRLAKEKDYEFVGSESHGGNAYFVRRDKLNGLKALSAKEGFAPSAFRQSRDSGGTLDFVAPEKQYDIIRGLPVLNVAENRIEKL